MDTFSRDYIARCAAIPSLAKSFEPSLAGLEITGDFY